MRREAAIFGLLVLTACSSGPSVPPQLAPDAERAVLQDRTREIVRPHCGSCHTTSSPQAVPDALAVYDLERQDWGGSMKRDQLGTFHRSILRKLPEAAEERAAIDAYVADLLARAAE